MLRTLEISGFRGITSGTLSDLFPLTVLVGPNNSGKSTCLEALLLGHTEDVRVLAYVVRRRGLIPAPRAAFIVTGAKTEIKIGFTPAGGDEAPAAAPPTRTTTIQIIAPIEQNVSKTVREQGGLEGAIEQLRVVQVEPTWHRTTSVCIDEGGRAFSLQESGGSSPVPRNASFFEPHVTPAELEVSLGRATNHGQQALAAMLATLQVIDPALRDVRALKAGNKWVPHAIYDRGSVPLASVGDGMKRLVELSAQLSSSDATLAIVEEPECFQHPKAVDAVVRLLWDNVTRGTQVIMSTHSMEFFDQLVVEAKRREGAIDKFGLFRMALSAGTLRAVRVPGNDAISLREELLEDLRR